MMKAKKKINFCQKCVGYSQFPTLRLPKIPEQDAELIIDLLLIGIKPMAKLHLTSVIPDFPELGCSGKTRFPKEMA